MSVSGVLVAIVHLGGLDVLSYESINIVGGSRDLSNESFIRCREESSEHYVIVGVGRFSLYSLSYQEICLP